MSDENEATQERAHDAWPNTVRTREELDSALEAGLKSGRSKLTVHEVFESRINASSSKPN